MMKRTTHVPNILFDQYLPCLSLSELKILLIIIRQTNGWINKKTGRRKKYDRITQGQFRTKTGLSRKSISKTLQKLANKRLITITDSRGKSLHNPNLRKGRVYMYFRVNLDSSIRRYGCVDMLEMIQKI